MNDESPSFNIYPKSFRCRECSEAVLFQSDRLDSHLRQRHQSSLVQYRAKYWSPAARECAEQNPATEKEAPVRVYSDNPRLVAVPVCRVCGERARGLAAHLLTCHQLSVAEYRSSYPPPPHRVKIYHRLHPFLSQLIVIL